MFSAVLAQSETEEEIKMNAEKLFENEEYVPATSLYLRLISLNPRNADYNFRYGTCLLFNSYKKQEAIRYLNYAVNESGIDPRAYYFHGRALHLNYQFEEAKASYQKYIQYRLRQDKRYDAERQIQMCDNGKRLLTTFTDIVVSEKKEIESEKFFRLYSNMETIGGTILVSADFQSKMDKKMGHVPVVHFPPNAKAIYYSSYGENGENGLDIYVRRRLPDNTWGDPQLLPGAVNTREDEDFPYMHPSGEYLYFSSKGHNSMGGYDVFYSLYNPDNGSFGTPQNVDFAISSPDDDLFYVVDSLHRSAYFASARQSQNGKLHVYRVRVARVPIQEVIIMGDYLSEINPENKSMTVTVSSHSNGQEVGKFKSDAKGKYAFVFPKGGKYNYEVKVDGKEDVYKFVVEVPFLDEFRPLKQKAVHTIEGENETVKIINLFDERVEGAEALMAEVIRKHAELEVNEENFDLEELDAQNERNELLAELGFRNMTSAEISDQLAELTMNEQLKIQQVERIKTNLNLEILRLTEELKEQDARIDQLREQLTSATDPAQKHSILEEIKRLEGEKEFTSTSIKEIDQLRNDAVSTVSAPSESGIGKMEILENQFNALLAGEKEEEALKLLERNKALLQQAHNASPESMVKKMVEESLSVQAEVRRLSEREKELEAEKRRLEGEIRVLDNQLIDAKKKDIETIKSNIKAKQSELALVEEMIVKTGNDLDNKRFEQSLIDDQIAVLQRAMVEENTQNVNLAEVKKAVQEAEKASVEVEQSTTEQDLAVLERDNPELNPEYVPEENQAKVLEVQNEAAEQEILQNPTLSDAEKIDARIALNEETLGKIEQRVNEIGKQPQTEALNREKQNLILLRKELEQENKTLDDSRPTENVFTALQDEYRKEYNAILNNNNLTQEERIDQQLETIQSSIAKVEKRMAILEEDEITPKEQTEYDALKEWRTSLQQESDLVESTPIELATTASKLREDYAAQIETLNDNTQMSNEERLREQLSAVDQTMNAIGERLVEVNKQIARNDTPELQEEKEDLEALKRSLTEERQEWKKELDEIQSSSVAAISPEDVVKQMVPEYQDNVRRIESDPDLNEQEKLELLQQEDQKLTAALNQELNGIQEQLNADPENTDLLARNEMIQGILGEKEEQIQNRQAAIDALNQAVPEVNLAAVREAVLQEVNPIDENRREEARNSAETPFEQENAVLELEQTYLEQLQEKLQEAETQRDRNPEDQALAARVEILEELENQQERILLEQKNRTANNIAEAQIEAIIAKVDRRYGVEIGELERANSPDRSTLIANREEDLQKNLRAAISNGEEALNRTYSVSAELELMTLRKALAGSEEREETARAQQQIEVPVTENKEDFVRDLRVATMGEGQNPMEMEYRTAAELRTQDQMLIFYENTLSENLEDTKKEAAKNPDDRVLEQRVKWLEEELEAVREKRRQILVTIGELETAAIVENQNDNATKAEKVESLQQQENELQASLNDPGLTSTEKKAVQEQLEEVHQERVEKENELLVEESTLRSKENAQLTEVLKTYSNDENPALTEQIKAYEQEELAIQEQLDAAEKAKSEEERNYLLNEASERQGILQDQLNVAILEEKLKRFEEQENIALYSSEELEQRRRTFTVQIGELSTQIEQIDREIEGAKKKEIPPLQTQRATLLAQRSALELQLQDIERRLAESQVNDQAVSNEALEQSLSYNEERQTAASETYAEYYKLANEALEVEQQIANLETELKQEQNRVKTLLADPERNENDPEIQLSVSRIKEIQQEIDKHKIDLVQRKYDAERALPSDEEEAMRMQNLVIRGIQPIKTAVVATALINLPSNGLAINEAAPSVYSVENPIPVGVKNPTGLVYRVQIGAFAKPIPQDLFKEFNPVSGEKIDGTNITRYMAGFFNNSAAVVDAREQIRALGYNDAFVVAYCDGERIQFGEAKRREAEGTCVPKGDNELLMEVAVNTAEKLGIPIQQEVKEVSEYSYAQVPGAAQTDPIEMKQGLFFTVQIGVYNRPVGPEHTFGMEELLTIRLPNGQIRYSSGMFSSVEEAMPRRQIALNNGVVGAFVCAYYKGERISLAEAKRLLSEQGISILQSEIEKNEQPETVNTVEIAQPVNPVIVDTAAAQSAAPVSVERVDQRIQIVTRKTFEEFPRDVLNRYNAEGNFYYDANDQHVKSVIYNNVDDLPRLWNFRDDIDTIYISVDEMVMDSLHTIEVALPGSQAPGDFMDWLMRFNYRKEFYRNPDGIILRIYGIEPNHLQAVLGIVRKFGLTAREFENLELENH